MNNQVTAITLDGDTIATTETTAFKIFQAAVTAWAEDNYDSNYGAQCVIECRDPSDWEVDFMAAISAVKAKDPSEKLEKAIQWQIDMANVVADHYNDINAEAF